MGPVLETAILGYDLMVDWVASKFGQIKDSYIIGLNSFFCCSPLVNVYSKWSIEVKFSGLYNPMLHA